MIQIEDKPVVRVTVSGLADFVAALKRLGVGQSFLMPKMNAQERTAISVVQYVLSGRRFTTARCDKGYRVGRVE